MTKIQRFVLIAILSLGLVLRIFGLNWDQNNHLHPDERFLTMVATSMKWTSNYLDTKTSTLNPHNIGYGFYVYGTFPVILVKFIADKLNYGDYNNIALVGRATSAVLDLGTTVLVFLITRRLFKNTTAALLAMFAYAISVLPIQLSHFFAVDTALVFFLTLSFYSLITKRYVLLGIAYGLALSSKISAVVFSPVIALYFLRKFKPIIIFSLTCLFTLRLAYPYLFNGYKLNSLLLANWQQLKTMSVPSLGFPPSVQWIHITPYLFPLENFLYWGMGLPLGIIALAALVFCLFRCFRHPQAMLAMLWIFILFVYQASQPSPAMRYFYPLYPFLTIFIGMFLHQILSINKFLLISILALISIWPLSFISIYSRPHSRVAATNWILQNVPEGSTISCEHWDDCLPIGYHFPPYKGVEFPLYGPDTPEKWAYMNDALQKTDYIILSSNRLYGSIMTVPEYYPETIKFYKNLFNGSLGFKLVAQFTSRPNLPIPGLNLCLTPSNIIYGKIARSVQNCPLSGISFVDDYSEELFTVYDHPKVLIFQKT